MSPPSFDQFSLLLDEFPCPKMEFRVFHKESIHLARLERHKIITNDLRYQYSPIRDRYNRD